MAISPYINYIGKDFDINRISRYGLTIQILLGGFSFLMYDSESKQPVAFLACNGVDSIDGLMQALENFCSDNNIESESLKSVTCIFDDTSYAIVPSAFFEREYAETYLNFCSDNEGDEVLSEHLDKGGCEVVYGLKKSLAEQLHQFSDKIVFRHSSAIVIDGVLPKNRGLSQYVNVRHSDFDVMVADGDRMLFYNSFKFNGVDEFVYYLVTVMRQYGNAEEMNLYFMGMLMPDSEVVKLARRYVRNIGFVEDVPCLPEADMPGHCFYVPLSVV